MLGLDTFFPFGSFFVLFFLFFHAEEFWNTGLMWAPCTTTDNIHLIFQTRFMRYSIGKGQEGRCTRAFWFYDSCLLYELMV